MSLICLINFVRSLRKVLLMTYSRLIIGDGNVVKFWSASQSARPQLVGVPLKSVVCMDTFDAALQEVSQELDYVLMSIVTGFLIEEGSALDVRGSCVNILEGVLAKVDRVAKRHENVEVVIIVFFFAS